MTIFMKHHRPGTTSNPLTECSMSHTVFSPSEGNLPAKKVHFSLCPGVAGPQAARKARSYHLLLLIGSAMGIPIRMQFAASGLSGWGRSSQFGSFSLIRIMGLDLAKMYSV